MRLRFLAIAGPEDAVARHAARAPADRGRPLARILRAPGLLAWAPGDVPFVAAADQGAVAVGLMFESASGERLRQLPLPLPAPAELTRRYWGAYALLAATDTGHLVLRDPSDGAEVYHRRSGPLDVYASDIDLLDAAGADPLRPDVGFVRRWLTFPYLRGRGTGIEGVEEVVPGEVRDAAGGRAGRALAWSPWAHAAPECAIHDFERAADRLREAILQTVPRLAEDAADPVLQLSGGLDSSIVAAALAAAGRPFRAVTFATLAPDGDERLYAREVARHCGSDLAELVEFPRLPDFAQVPPRSLRPPPNALLRPVHAALAHHLAVTGADLVLDGTGGDNVFAYAASASPALDAFAARGWREGLRALDDLARIHETTVWSVARAAWRRSRRPRQVWPRETSFLADGAPAEGPAHPWLEDAAGIPRGTYEQVQSIVGIRHFIPEPRPDSPAALHPLLAQPVVEACLAIPSWLWLRGGRDRAVARAAVRGLLPGPILARRSKGRLESLFVSGYMARRRELEAVLLEGRLAREALLDGAAVRAYLHRDEQPSDAGYIRLLEIASAESWLRAFGP